MDKAEKQSGILHALLTSCEELATNLCVSNKNFTGFQSSEGLLLLKPSAFGNYLNCYLHQGKEQFPNIQNQGYICVQSPSSYRPLSFI